MKTKHTQKTGLSGAKKASRPNGLMASPTVPTPLQGIRGIRGAKKAHLWLGLTLAHLGQELARLTGRVKPFDRRTVFGWESGKPMAREIVDAYGILIANRLTERLGRTIGVKLVANSPWYVTAWAKCLACGTWFELHRAKQKACNACRAAARLK